MYLYRQERPTRPPTAAVSSGVPGAIYVDPRTRSRSPGRRHRLRDGTAFIAHSEEAAAAVIRRERECGTLSAADRRVFVDGWIPTTEAERRPYYAMGWRFAPRRPPGTSNHLVRWFVRDDRPRLIQVEEEDSALHVPREAPWPLVRHQPKPVSFAARQALSGVGEWAAFYEAERLRHPPA